MYSCDTSACYLPDGISNLTRIPHNDKVDVKVSEGDNGQPSDVPLPFDDHTTINPNAS